VSDVRLDDAAIKAYLDDEDGPVGVFLAELAGQAAGVARSVVPVRVTPTWSSRSNARPPGFTKAAIRVARGHGYAGALWTSANAPADPAIFLEDPAEQLTHKYPFLTTGLWSLEGTF
jgi:hypothetical protein